MTEEIILVRCVKAIGVMAGVAAVLAFSIPLAAQEQRVIEERKLFKKNGLVYEVDTEKPFTGIAVSSVFYHDEGQVREGCVEITYTDGIERKRTERNWNGQTAFDHEYLDEKSERWQSYSEENGQKIAEFELRNDQMTGRAIFWYESGQKESEIEYHAGVLVSRIEWDTNGNLIQPPQPQPSPTPIT